MITISASVSHGTSGPKETHLPEVVNIPQVEMGEVGSNVLPLQLTSAMQVERGFPPTLRIHFTSTSGSVPIIEAGRRLAHEVLANNGSLMKALPLLFPDKIFNEAAVGGRQIRLRESFLNQIAPLTDENLTITLVSFFPVEFAKGGLAFASNSFVCRFSKDLKVQPGITYKILSADFKCVFIVPAKLEGATLTFYDDHKFKLPKELTGLQNMSMDLDLYGCNETMPVTTFVARTTNEVDDFYDFIQRNPELFSTYSLYPNEEIQPEQVEQDA